MTSLVILTYISAMLYLDYAASTPLCEEALEVLENSFRDDFANPSAAHQLGKGLSKRIENARRFFLESLGAKPDDQFIFTSSATESNNLIIKGLEHKGKILYSAGDHPSIVAPIQSLENELLLIPLLVGGAINLQALLELVDKEVSLLSLPHVNNQSGNFHDVDEIAKRVKEKHPKIHIHVDGVQAYSKLPINLRESGIDSYSISSHKIEGPKGIAGLFLKKGITLEAQLLGGGQEAGFRSSTQAAPLIFSFEAAARKKCAEALEAYAKIQEHDIFLRESLRDKIEQVKFPFPVDVTSPYILTFLIPGISSDIILRHLEQKEIYLSSSSACSSKVKGKNPSFSALGIAEQYHKNVLRVSLANSVKREDLRYFVDELANIMEELKLYMR